MGVTITAYAPVYVAYVKDLQENACLGLTTTVQLQTVDHFVSKTLSELPTVAGCQVL